MIIGCKQADSKKAMCFSAVEARGNFKIELFIISIAVKHYASFVYDLN